MIAADMDLDATTTTAFQDFIRLLLRPLPPGGETEGGSRFHRFYNSILKTRFVRCLQSDFASEADDNVYALLGKWTWHDNDEQMPMLSTMPTYAQRRFWSLMVSMLHEGAIAPGSMVIDNGDVSGCIMADNDDRLPVLTVQQLARRYLMHCDDVFCQKFCNEILEEDGGAGGSSLDAQNKDSNLVDPGETGEGGSMRDRNDDDDDDALEKCGQVEDIVATDPQRRKRPREDEKEGNSGNEITERMAVSTQHKDKEESIPTKRRKVDVSPESVQREDQDTEAKEIAGSLSLVQLSPEELKAAQHIYKQQLTRLKADDKRTQKLNIRPIVKLLVDCTERCTLHHLLTMLKLDKKLNDQSLLVLVKPWIQHLQDQDQSTVARSNAAKSIDSFFDNVLLPRAIKLNKAASRVLLDVLQLIARPYPSSFLLKFCLPLLSRTSFTFRSQHFELINRVLKVLFTEDLGRRRDKTTTPNIVEDSLSSLHQIGLSQDTLYIIDDMRTSVSHVTLPQFFIHHCVIKPHEELQWSDFLIKTLINVIDSMNEGHTSSKVDDATDELLGQLLFVLSQHSTHFRNSIPFVSLVQSIMRTFRDDSTELVKCTSLIREMMQQNETFLARQLVEELDKRA